VRDDWLSDEELAAYMNDKVALPQLPCRLRYAHTSPIYVAVDGRGAAVRASLEEGLQMLDAFEEFARKQASRESMPVIMDATERGRARLRARLGGMN
jgi:hypothetical protein